MARKLKLVAVVVVVIVAIGGYLWWQDRQERKAAEQGLAASRVLSAVFQRTGTLEVSRLTGDVQARSKAVSGYVFENEQITRAPYSVAYTLDLRQLKPAAWRWNGETKTMTVDLPEVTVAAPAIDMAKAQVSQTGMFISRTGGQALQRQAAERLTARAYEEARKPENLAKAREAARGVVADFVRAPLQAANNGDVTVTVRLPGEAKPANMAQDQWDVSRSIEQVYRDFPGND